MVILSTLLFAGVALGAGLDLGAVVDEDDYREEYDLGAPRDREDDQFQLFRSCPKSGARQHTMAQMTVSFGNSCADVKAEISARASANANGQWTDPHNKGKYQLLNDDGNMITVKRRTGNNRYTDVITFALQDLGTGMCTANACSVSQGNSNNDAGTNMCNMMNLFCNGDTKNTNTGVACQKVKTDLSYNFNPNSLVCGRYTNNNRFLAHYCQNFETTCLLKKNFEDEEALELPSLEQPVLGAPRDHRHDNFIKLPTCPGSGAREHTMAQMSVTFTNGCADVKEEIQARATKWAVGTNGDPHNGGHYTIENAGGNMIKVKRRNGNNKYTDVVTMELTTNGDGCSVNACSESQGNSNNDAGTNMCNMENLFCANRKNTRTGVECKAEKHDLEYAITYKECGRYENNNAYRQHTCQNFEDTCLTRDVFVAEEDLEETEDLEARPRDHQNRNFRLFPTCPRSGAREHTMAQSTIEFTNACADVAAEMKARAAANQKGTWTDPHNRGKYTLLDGEGSTIKFKRRTGNNRYTDVITMAMETTDTGCKVNACSVSQGNSNNDAGTNMCNMSNLYCNSQERNGNLACKPVETNLAYKVTYQECGRYRNNNQYLEHQCQDLARTCLRNPSELEVQAPFHVLKTLFDN